MLRRTPRSSLADLAAMPLSWRANSLYGSRPSMAILFLIVFIDLVGFGIVIPLLPYYALHFHASPITVTSMMACYSLAQFVSSPLLGRLSDRIGRRPVLLASLA